MGGGLQVPSGSWLMLGICSFSVAVLHAALLVPVLMYGNETMLWKEKERSKIRAVQMGSIRGLLGIRRMDRVLNAQIRELCGVKKCLDERIDEGMLCWYAHVKSMDRDRIVKRVYVGVCAGSHSVVVHGRDRLIL